MKRAQARAKGPPALAPMMLNCWTARWSASVSTSVGQSTRLLFAGVERPQPGRSMVMRRAPTVLLAVLKPRPTMREPGMPWKRKMTGSEGLVEPYVA